ncbi:MAG: hypothetical protein L0Y58_07830, partial [Verrucomicrobia subdivision 3 bacterium]|nr:hypothetical protein [Limisphaerales bacterium]
MSTIFAALRAIDRLGTGSETETITRNAQLFVFPLASVAVQVTVLVPTAKFDPLAGSQATSTPEQLSLAIASKVTVRVQELVAFVTMLAGQPIDGGCVSLIVTVKLHSAVLPDASVAVQSTVVTPLAKVPPEG